MSFKNAIVFAMGLTAVLSSCTSRNQKVVEVQPARLLPTGTVTPGAGGNTAEIPVTLDEAKMKAYGDTTNMNYKFSYLTVTQAQPITFTAGTAQIKIQGLPASQAGTVVLDIYEGTTLKLHGEKANVTLGVGVNNNIQLNLAPPTGTGGVNPGGGAGTTDLTIDVTLDNGTGTNPGTGSVVPGSGGSGTNPGTGTGSIVDPIAGWDGKSFLGNAKWTIVPVNG